MGFARSAPGGFLLRLVAALGLILGTFNPDGWSYYHWVVESGRPFGALQAFVGVALLVGWVFFLKSTYESLGILGTLLAAAFFGTLLWLLASRGIFTPQSPKGLTYLVLIGLAFVLATGMTWSFVRRRVAGQVDVDSDQS